MTEQKKSIRRQIQLSFLDSSGPASGGKSSTRNQPLANVVSLIEYKQRKTRDLLIEQLKKDGYID
jgi:hypothetical protein